MWHGTHIQKPLRSAVRKVESHLVPCTSHQQCGTRTIVISVISLHTSTT